MSDHDEAWAGLVDRASQPSAVQNSPGDAKPQLNKASDEAFETGSQATAKEIGDIFPDDPSSPRTVGKLGVFKGKAASTSFKTLAWDARPGTVACAVVLTGGAADKKVNWSIFYAFDLGEVADQRDIRIAVSQHGAGCGFDFGIAKRLPAQRLPCGGRCADPGTDIDISHAAFLSWEAAARSSSRGIAQTCT